MYLVACQGLSVGVRYLCITVASAIVSYVLAELLPMFSSLYNWLSTLLPKLYSEEKNQSDPVSLL